MSERLSQPPPFHTLLEAYKSDPASVHLRLGQWFINRYMPDCMDATLYTARENVKALKALEGYYQHYQWEK